MSVRTITWEDKTLTDRLLRSMSKRLSALFTPNSTSIKQALSYTDFIATEKLEGHNLLITLPPSLAFTGILDGRSTHPKDLQNILANQAEQISPLMSEKHTVLACIDPQQKSLIHTLILRDKTLEDLSRKAASLGMPSIYLTMDQGAEVVFPVPGTSAQKRFTRNIWCVAFISFLTSTWLSSNLLLNRIEGQYEALRIYEAGLRAEVLQRAEDNRQITAFDELASRSSDTLTIGARFNALEKLSRATPDTAWWENVSFERDRIIISGLSENAAIVLQTLSEQYPNQSPSFVRPLTNEEGGKQAYEIQLSGGKS